MIERELPFLLGEFPDGQLDGRSDLHVVVIGRDPAGEPRARVDLDDRDRERGVGFERGGRSADLGEGDDLTIPR